MSANRYLSIAAAAGVALAALSPGFAQADGKSAEIQAFKQEMRNMREAYERQMRAMAERIQALEAADAAKVAPAAGPAARTVRIVPRKPVIDGYSTISHWSP